MFRWWFDKESELKPPEWRGPFKQFYDPLEDGVCLCDGLRIVEANTAFGRLVGREVGQSRVEFLNQVIGDQSVLDALFSGEVCSARCRLTTDHAPRDVTLSVRQSGFGDPHLLLVIRDESNEVQLQRALDAQVQRDQRTGLLLPGPFMTAMAQRLDDPVRGRQGFTYCQLLVRSGSGGGWDFEGEDATDLLVAMYERLAELFGDHCLAGMSNGATFGCLLDGGKSTEEADRLAAQLGRILSTTVAAYLAGHAQWMTHVGYATTHVAETDAAKTDASETCAEELLHRAGLALIDARRRGDGLVRYSSDLQSLEDRRLRLKDDLPVALKEGQLETHFQPIIHAVTGDLSGFEALIRWTHPQFGRVPPPEIVDIARQCNAMTDLTRFVLGEALDEARRWPEEIRFAVNVTPDQIGDPLVDMVRRTLHATDIDPARLEIEVTEEAMAGDFDHSATIFDRLRAIGVHIAMDDFGAGATSISNLRRLSFNKLKIDKCISDGLPHDPRSVAIVKSLMYMARDLHLSITVEGIEDEQQLNFLKAFNCGIQGYVFSPPVPRSRIDDMRGRLPGATRVPSDAPRVLGIGPKPQGNRALKGSN